MLGAKTSMQNAERLKKFLLHKKLLHTGYLAKQEGSSVLFPLRGKFTDKRFRVKFVQAVFPPSLLEKKSMKEVLLKALTEREKAYLRRGFDTMGDIALIDVPKELQSKEKLIAETILSLHKNIRTVLKKKGIHAGTFRLQPLQYLAGEKKKEALYKENGVVMKLNVEKVYFSPRLANERKRIASLVKPRERVLVMFSGCAPYPLVIARHSQAKEITGIELNPAAHMYAEQNAALNKAKHVQLIHGDVRKIVPQLKKTYERICMPLPKGAENFLTEAFLVSKKGTIIHFYDFLHEKDFPQKAIEKIERAARKNKKKIKILNHIRCGEYAPHVYRVCVDFAVL